MKTRIAERLRGTNPAADLQTAARASLPSAVAAALFERPLVPAAVLVPLIERVDGLTVLLTRRTDHLRDHPGQVSFPGGRLDAGDAGPREAALRETTEELGIPQSLVEIAGYLPPHAIVTGYAVTPVVGFLPDSLVVQPDAFEVAEAFEVPLRFLLDPSNAIAGTRRVATFDIPVWEFHYDRHRIWGATAQILKSFIKLIE